MSRLAFTPSKDGEPRVSMRIEFRVGLDHLEEAGAEVVWKGLIDVDDLHYAEDAVEPSERLAATLTRRAVLEAVRDRLRANGYSDPALMDDEFGVVAREAAEPVVRRLFPEATL